MRSTPSSTRRKAGKQTRFLWELKVLEVSIVYCSGASLRRQQHGRVVPWRWFAGKYKVRPISSASANVLLVRSEDNRAAEIVCTNSVQSTKPVANGKLIFNRYGDQYFLSEMWFPGERIGNQLVKSEREEALLREITPRKKREKVTVRITEAKPN